MCWQPDDIIAAFALSALSIWIMIEATALKSPAAVTTAPGLLPFMCAGMLLIMAIVLGVSALRRRHTTTATIADDIPDDLDLSGYAGVIVGGGPGCVSDSPEKKSKIEAKIEAECLSLMPQITARDIPFLGCCYGIGST